MSNSSRRRRPRRRRPSTTAAAGESKHKKATSARKKSRRRRRRPRKTSPAQPKIVTDNNLQVHHNLHEDAGVQALNKNTFIYTYTVYPRHYLDNYQGSSSVTERMVYEGPDQDG